MKALAWLSRNWAACVAANMMCAADCDAVEWAARSGRWQDDRVREATR